jgi:hypothetical protein
LVNTTVDLEVDELDEKSNLQIQINTLLDAAAIIRAKFFKKVGIDSAKEDFINHIKNAASLLNDDDADLEEFLQDIENGFTGYQGITNNTNPYGRPYAQRPKIKEIKE